MEIKRIKSDVDQIRNSQAELQSYPAKTGVNGVNGNEADVRRLLAAQEADTETLRATLWQCRKQSDSTAATVSSLWDKVHNHLGQQEEQNKATQNVLYNIEQKIGALSRTPSGSPLSPNWDISRTSITSQRTNTSSAGSERRRAKAALLNVEPLINASLDLTGPGTPSRCSITPRHCLSESALQPVHENDHPQLQGLKRQHGQENTERASDDAIAQTRFALLETLRR